jgi:hypothetical protein
MKRMNLIIAVCIVSTILFLSACRIEPVCGNRIQEYGEDYTTCCLDAGCPENLECVNNTCATPECGECQYFDGEQAQCVDYECCDDSDCGADQECKEHECSKLLCGYCQYIENNQCKNMKCCVDKDCDDNDASTTDMCKFPATKNSACVNEELETCDVDSDCDDDDDSTEDVCVDGNPNECIHISITKCKDGDGYCPDDCTYSEDDDCESDVEDCGSSVSCFKDALEDCDPASVSFKMDIDNSTHHMDVVPYLEILGYNDDDDCEVSFEFDTIDVDFTDSFISDLEDDDYSDDDIDNLLDDSNDDMDDWEGEDGECAFQDDEIDDVKSIIDDWRNDDFNPKDDMDSYDCSGDFFDWEWD